MPLNDGYSYREILGPRQLTAGDETVLDHLTRRFTHSTRTEWLERLAVGQVRLQDSVVSGQEVLRAGQALVWTRPPWNEPDVPTQFTVIYRDESLLAVAKPSGLPTLPGGGYFQQTLLFLVRQRWPEASPLHRLGRGTSGLVLFALTHRAASSLSHHWREHEVEKTYLALAQGVAREARYDVRTAIGPVSHPVLGRVYAASPDGRASRSVATVLEQRPGSVLFEVDLFTGRPHQIRIHLASIGHPLVGDPLYAPGGRPLETDPGLPGDGGYLLHSARLGFVHPVTGTRLDLQALPPDALKPGGSVSANLTPPAAPCPGVAQTD